MKSTVPATATTVVAAPVVGMMSLNAWFAEAKLSEGNTCHRPKSDDETRSTRHVPMWRDSMPHSTERKATSSSRIVPSGMTTKAVSSASDTPNW